MVIPREDKYVRLYIQVTEVDENGKAVCEPKIASLNYPATYTFLLD